jgi:hypothetical protein
MLALYRPQSSDNEGHETPMIEQTEKAVEENFDTISGQRMLTARNIFFALYATVMMPLMFYLFDRATTENNKIIFGLGVPFFAFSLAFWIYKIHSSRIQT